jgi:ubiquinone/menaquinone biosynthesis C-methylase UbiE
MEKVLKMSNVENALYNDARLVDLYDLLNSGDWDYAFYADQIGKRRQRVLDLGCGTGTFALRLAAEGHEVVAVDPSSRMVDFARSRQGSDEVEWIVGGVEYVRSHPAFDVVVMTGHAFQCLLTDHEVEATLRTVREVLREGGRFMFESRNPVVQPWLDWIPARSTRVIKSEKHGSVEVFHECIAMVESCVEFETHYRFACDGTEQISRSRLHFMSKDALAGHIAATGSRETRWFGDWSGGPFEEATSREIIAICYDAPSATDC